MPSIHLLPGSRIRDGARLRVSYYHGTMIYADQDHGVPICPSSAKVREIWKQQFPLIEKYLAPKRYFLDIGDEQRAFNRDESCKRRKMTTAALLGDTAQWLYDQIHAVNPKAQVLGWSDMFDPNHNAVNKYFLVDGSLEGAWKYLPRNMGTCAGISPFAGTLSASFPAMASRHLLPPALTLPLSIIPKGGWRSWTPRPALRESCTQPGMATSS